MERAVLDAFLDGGEVRFGERPAGIRRIRTEVAAVHELRVVAAALEAIRLREIEQQTRCRCDRVGLGERHDRAGVVALVVGDAAALREGAGLRGNRFRVDRGRPGQQNQERDDDGAVH